MKRERFQTALTTILGLVCLGLLVQTAWSAEVPRITKEELGAPHGGPVCGHPGCASRTEPRTHSDRKIQA